METKITAAFFKGHLAISTISLVQNKFAEYQWKSDTLLQIAEITRKAKFHHQKAYDIIMETSIKLFHK